MDEFSGVCWRLLGAESCGRAETQGVVGVDVDIPLVGGVDPLALLVVGALSVQRRLSL